MSTLPISPPLPLASASQKTILATRLMQYLKSKNVEKVSVLGNPQMPETKVLQSFDLPANPQTLLLDETYDDLLQQMAGEGEGVRDEMRGLIAKMKDSARQLLSR